jgi:uncharacterized protein YidB (DUF937 family)
MTASILEPIAVLSRQEDKMGLFDDLGGVLKSVLGQDANASTSDLISAGLAKTNFGDMQGLLTQLQQSGLGTQVQSWLGKGENLPISAEQIQAVLGNEQVQQLAQHFGIPTDAALKLLSQHLPAAVDQASPDGTLQS